MNVMTTVHELLSCFRSSCPQIKGFLRNFVKCIGKNLCQSLFFNKVAGLRPATSLKKRLWHRCFPVNFAKFLRTPFLLDDSSVLLTYSVPMFPFYFIVFQSTNCNTILKSMKVKMNISTYEVSQKNLLHWKNAQILPTLKHTKKTFTTVVK